MAQMTQEQIDRLLTPDMAHGISGKKTVKNPKYNRNDVSSTEPETLDLDVQQWVAPDGRVIQAVQMPDQTWEVIRNEPATPKPPTATSGRTAREEAEIAANAALPPDQDPRPETNAERAARADQTRRQQDTTVVSTTYVGTGKNRKKVTEYQSGRKVTEDAATNASPVSVSYDADGTKVTKYDDGTETREQLSPAQRRAEDDARRATRTEKPVQGKDGKQYTEVTEKDPTTGQTRTYYTDSTGKEVPLPGDPQIPTNAPKFTPDWQKPGLGIIEYASAVRARPDLTDEQKAKLISEAHSSATATVSHGNAVLSAQQTEASRQTTQRGQDTVQANQRLSTSGTNFGTAVKAAQDDTKYSLGPQAASVLPYYLAMAQAAGMGAGGYYTPPPVNPGAAVTQMQGQTIPGLSSMLPGSFKPGAPGSTPPNAIGVGSVGAIPAPDQAAAASAAAEAARQQGAAAGPPPTAGEPGGPPLAPGPVLGDPPPGPVAVPDTGAPYTPQAAGGPPIFSPGPRPAPGSINSPQPAPPTGIPGNPDYQPGLPPGTSIIPQPPTQYPYNVPGDPNFDPSLPRGYAPGNPGVMMMRASTTPEMEAPGNGRKPRWRGEGAPGAGTTVSYPLVQPDRTGQGTDTNETIEPSGGRIIYEPMLPPGNQPAPAEMPSSSTPVFSPWHTTAPNGTYHDQTPEQTYHYQPSTTEHNPNVAPWHTPGAPGGVNIESPVPNAYQRPPSGGGLASMLGNVGPWAGQPQQQPGPTGAGAMLMQRAGGYDPTGLNRMLADAGIDPDVIMAMGGVG